jgi:S-methylmethionine-dependent homocysteine/selenocysteine methylase
VQSACAQAAALGASTVLVNCIPVSAIERYLEPLARVGVPFGAYANAGQVDEGFGWRADPSDATRYADAVERWVELGATVVGGCCGTGREHVRELARRFAS